MYTNRLCVKKRWKPPYGMTTTTATLLLLALLNFGVVQAQHSKEDLEDGIEVSWESSPYSITFLLNDTEHYEIESVTCKNSKFMDDEQGQQNICDNLNPCITYTATLTIKLLSNPELQYIEKTVEASTMYIEPIVEIFSIESYVEEIYLIWNATDKTCISSFQIEVRSIDKEFKWTIANLENELKADGLNPCQDHNIQLKTYNVNNALVSNLTSTTATQYAEPGNVTVTIEPNEKAQMKLTWEQPQYKTCIKYYYLKWFILGCDAEVDVQTKQLGFRFSEGTTETTLGDSSVEIIEPEHPNTETDVCEWFANLTDQNSRDYTISGLHGCEMYRFQMYINSDTILKSEEDFKSPEQVPGIVIAETPEISAVNIKLNWSPPLSNSRCVDHYKVFVTGPLQRINAIQTSDAETNETSANFNELDPCGQYNYTIVAYSLNGTAGIALNSTFETYEAKPTPVRNGAVVAEPFALKVSWEPPAFADLCLNGYRLSGWMDENTVVESFDKTTNDTDVTFEKLYSCQSYTIQIIPTTKSMDGELLHIETETAATQAQPPTTFQAIAQYSHGLELSAQSTDFNNTCEKIFACFICVLRYPDKALIQSAEQYVEGVVGGISFKATLAPLSPNTEYRCYVALFNIAGWSANQTMLGKTEPYFPDPPAQVGLKSSTNTSINFNWKAPSHANGNIKLYISYFQKVKAAYYIPPICNVVTTEPIKQETSSLEQVFSNLLPFTRYSIQVAAQNEYGVGEFTRPYMVVTSPWISEPVTNLKLTPEGPYESDTVYQANVVVTWLTPCKSNGEIESFELQFEGERADHERENFQRSIAPTRNNDGDFTAYDFVYNETNLKPEYNYSVTVVVRTKGVALTSAASRGMFDAPAGIPKRLNSSIVEVAQVDPYKAQNPTISAVVQFPANILESDSGTIMYIALLVSEKHCNPEPQMRYGALDTIQDWPHSLSWSQVHEDGNADECIKQYQTTPLRWKPVPTNNTRESSDEVILYTIGMEKCADSSERYCNGPLKADTEYDLVIRLFTKSGFNDAAVLEFKTDSLIQLKIIIISITCCLLLAFIAGFIYLWITKRIMWQRESCHGIEDSFGDIISKNFAIYYREISKPDKIAREFKELKVVALDLSYSASELGCNKNRYADIFPYDKNRVILDIDAEGSDYINASFIDGYRRKKEYIATQGPKPESTVDFWRMVLQHNVRVIVMVTQFREHDVVKCHEYFPYKSKGVNVSVRKKDSFELYDRTEMMVTHNMYGLKQKVVHFFFKKWPDHGCPIDPMHLVQFVRKVKSEKVPNYSPIVVHCSAGVGRTGTFIGLDIILQRLKSESKINIYETVKKLRFQRMMMVQTLTQYTFLYTCAYELVKHKNTRAVLKYQHQQQHQQQQQQQHHSNKPKKVSFQDEEEEEPDQLTIVAMPTTKFRRNGSDLNSVDEYEHHTFEKNGVSVPTIRFNSLRKGSDLDSLDEIPDYDDGHNGGSGESAL